MFGGTTGVFYSMGPFLSHRRYGHNLSLRGTSTEAMPVSATGLKVDTHMLGKGFWMEAS